jgi:hypothetical protein
MNLAGCPALVTNPEHRVWYRAIEPQYWPTALQSVHSVAAASRYSPGDPAKPSYPVLYLAEDHQVALFEVGALVGSPLHGRHFLPNPQLAWTILNVQVILQNVADLTLLGEQQKLLTSAQELTGDWECYRHRTNKTSVKEPIGLAPTQILGQTLYQLPGLEAFRTISAKVPTQMSLVVFPDKLLPNSRIVFHDHGTGTSFTIPSAVDGAATP